MLKSLRVEGVGPVAELAADFGLRLNVLTGDNGVGKSFLLDLCFWVLTGSWPGGRVALPDPKGKRGQPRIEYGVQSKTKEAHRAARYDFKTQTWSRQAGRPPMPGLVIYAAVDGGFAVWDPARNYWREGPAGRVERGEQPRAYQFRSEDLQHGLALQDVMLCEGLVRDWVGWYYRGTSTAPAQNGGGTSPIALLAQVVEGLAHPEEPLQLGEPRRVFVDEAKDYPTLQMPYGLIPYPHWSAAVRRIATLAYLLVWAWTEHAEAAKLRGEETTNRVVLLVDEVESHLHPKWQRVIVPALLKVAKGLSAEVQVQILAATHSPLVLASLEPHFDEELDRFFCFDLAAGAVTFAETPWAKHGDVVAWLTSDVFGLEQARSREAEAAIEAAEAFMRDDLPSLPAGLRTKEQIHSELLRVLAGLDPFWPRWIVYTRGDQI